MAFLREWGQKMAARSSIEDAAMEESSLQERKAVFPKSSRLLKRREFERISRYGKRLTGEILYAEVFYRQERGPKLGITVTRKYGDAVHRNRFKRLVREAFRLNHTSYPTDIHMNIRPRAKHKPLTLDQVQKDLKKLFG
jgi:ribonuclease P protein component